MKKVLLWIKNHLPRWLDLSHDEPWEKEPPKPFDWEDTAPSEYEPPDEDSNYASRHKSTPDSEKGAEEVVTMHEKMYRMATKNGTTITMGGSENLLNSN